MAKGAGEGAGQGEGWGEGGGAGDKREGFMKCLCCLFDLFGEE